MALFNTNLIIRETRKARGLTQEQLAEGICSRETVVKLERGARKPHWFVYRELLRRLGLDASLYQNQDELGTEDDIMAQRQFDKCIALMNALKHDDTKALLEDMDNSEVWQGGVWKERLLRLKASFYTIGINTSEQISPYVDASLAIDYAMESIYLTRPDFDLEKISEYFLSTNEYQALRLIAMANIHLGKSDESIKILYDLKNYGEKHHRTHRSSQSDVIQNEYSCAVTQLSAELLKVQRYEECLQIVDEAMAQFVRAMQTPIHYANFLSLKADALRALNRMEESRECSKKEILLNYVFDGMGLSFDEAKEYYEKEYSEKLDLNIPW